MDKEQLMDQLDYAQARIEELDDILINAKQTDKGYKEVIDVYNKWTDTYNDISTKIEHFDDPALDERKLEIEENRLQLTLEIENLKAELERDRQKLTLEIEGMRSNLERDHQTIMYEIEKDKINNEKERIQLDREKFAHDIEVQRRNEIEDIIFKTLDIGTKVSVPIIGGYFAMKLAILAYTKNGELELRDGTIWSLIKQIKV